MANKQANKLYFIQVSETFRGSEILKQSDCVDEIVLYIEEENNGRRLFATFRWPNGCGFKSPTIKIEMEAGDLVVEYGELFKILKDNDRSGVMSESMLMDVLVNYGVMDATFRL